MKKSSIVLVVISTLLLSSCGFFDRGEAYFTGYTKVCVEGVSYLQFSSGVTVQYDTNGKVVTCG